MGPHILRKSSQKMTKTVKTSLSVLQRNMDLMLQGKEDSSNDLATVDSNFEIVHVQCWHILPGFQKDLEFINIKKDKKKKNKRYSKLTMRC